MTVREAIEQYRNHGSYYLNSEDDQAVETLIEAVKSYDKILAELSEQLQIALEEKE